MIRQARLGAAVLLVFLMVGACADPTTPRNPTDRTEEPPKPPTPPAES